MADAFSRDVHRARWAVLSGTLLGLTIMSRQVSAAGSDCGPAPPVGLTVRVPLLPDSGSRASADHVDVVEYLSSAHDGWMFREWRLMAVGVKMGAPLEPWWSEANAPVPVIGRIRVKRCRRGVDADLGDLAALAGEKQSRPGLTEILNVELQPAFLGQGLGMMLVRAALADVPGDDIVVCEPTPSEYSNVPLETSAAAVATFYRRLGFTPDSRLPGYLTARRADLLL